MNMEADISWQGFIHLGAICIYGNSMNYSYGSFIPSFVANSLVLISTAKNELKV